ncbi:MAG: PQQ-dependent sugar dehydrogenase [Acidobacteria bacterium]|nr:PQQ-dependent sugar dehydrogenase [Acidobacteriota bacterium]
MTRKTLLAPVVCLLIATGVLSIAHAGTVPAGFVETNLPVDVFQLTDFDWDPTGDIWLISKLGKIEVLHVGDPAPTVVTQLANVSSDGEEGLVGLAIDPDFLTNHFIYFYVTDLGPPVHNKVIRAEVSGNSLLNITTLLDGPELLSIMHMSGGMRFGPDGMLYVTMGDNFQFSPAQDRGSLLGKVLRIARDGSIPSDNPFVSDPNARPEVWALGFRNAWRFMFQPVTGNLFLGDVGDVTWEELDVILKGQDYGWPLVEGPAPPGVAGMTYPIYSYNHNGTGAAIIGGDFMNTLNFPAQYNGNFFYADYALKVVYRMQLDSNNLPTSVEEFATNLPFITHVRVGPDGALYYCSINFQTIYRVAWVGGSNHQPSAIATATPTNGLNPLNVHFDGTGSSDVDPNTTLTYAWAFGDGGTSTAAAPNHTYSIAGSYTASLTVSDGSLTSSASIRIVSGNRAPTATISMPANGSFFNGGDTINFAGSASDPEEGTIPASGFDWTIVFHHNVHTHPFLGPISGITSGSFVTDTTGEPDPNIAYEIILDASDTGAPVGSAAVLTDRKSVFIYPNLSVMSFRATPRADLALQLNSKPMTPPADVTAVVGHSFTLGAVTPQTPGDGHTYVFNDWSDGGALQHSIATQPSNTTYTAHYRCNLITEISGVLASFSGGKMTLNWTAPSDLCLAAGGAVYHVYSAATARPATPPGNFPTSPAFTLIGTTTSTSLTFTPAVGRRFYLVVGIGSDGAEGPVGHYLH